MWLKVFSLAIVFILWAAPSLQAHSLHQNTIPLSLNKPKSQFFAGVVTRLSPGLVVVSRRIPGRAPEHRTFLITPKTKMAHALRLRLRVTVRFQRVIEGDVALEIQVRPKPLPPSATSGLFPSNYGAFSPIPVSLPDTPARAPRRLAQRSL